MLEDYSTPIVRPFMNLKLRGLIEPEAADSHISAQPHWPSADHPEPSKKSRKTPTWAQPPDDWIYRPRIN